MKYEDARPMNRDDALRALTSGEREQICPALVSLALHDPDWEFVQSRCLEQLGSDDLFVRGVAATCLGHLARIHGQLHLDEVLSALHGLETEPPGRVQDALDDIRMYLGAP